MSLHRLTSFLVLLPSAAAVASASIRSAGAIPALVRQSTRTEQEHGHDSQATLAAVDGLGRVMMRGPSPPLAASSPQKHDLASPSPGPSDELPLEAALEGKAALEEQGKKSQWSRLLTGYQLVFPEPQHPHHLWSFAFIERRWRAARGITTSLRSSSQQEGSEPLCAWFSGLLLSLALVGLLMARVGESLKVDMQRDRQAELVAMRGRPCWTVCCACSVAFLSLSAFLLTLFVLKAMTWRLHNLIPENSSSNDDNGLVVDSSGAIRYAKHPGERAYEAGQGVALSVALACFVILRWRRHDSVQITWALLAQFAVRGATFSAILATVLELIGSWGLNYEGITQQGSDRFTDTDKLATSGTTLGVVLLMLVVGVSEEFAKACAVVWGTWFSVAAVQNAGPQLCGKGCRVLVESPRALMLVGLSVGCGFMTVENAGYLVASSLSYDKNDSAFADRIVRVLIILTRAGLNLHPWLTGITSARLARVVFSRSDGTFTVREFFQAMSVSVLIHSTFDLLVMMLPGLLAMPLPLAYWLTCRHLFSKEWVSCEPAIESAGAAADPVEERTEGQR
mmetsp:Transcript_120739/g.225683  ORF Transcript_120739/g.225683 Transcript_120739/m.225683 type:complete len:566 (+) Transcript_120739:67-1764(+)